MKQLLIFCLYLFMNVQFTPVTCQKCVHIMPVYEKTTTIELTTEMTSTPSPATHSTENPEKKKKKECDDKYTSCPSMETRCTEPSIRYNCNKTCRVCEECFDFRDCSRYDVNTCSRPGIQADCQTTCHLCDTRCQDRLPTHRCREFEAAPGRCNDPYLRSVCKFTCGLCSPACSDILATSECDKLRRQRGCDSQYGGFFCRRTCNKCNDFACKDLIAGCHSYLGRCREPYFQRYCQRSCGGCNILQPGFSPIPYI